MDLKVGTDKLYISGNQTEKTAAFDLNFDGVIVTAKVDPALNTLAFSKDDIAFNGEANTEKGSISFEKGNDKFGVGLNKGEGSGFLNLDISGTKLDIAANTSAKTGTFLIEVDATKINAEVSPELKSLAIETTGTSLAISTDGSTKGDVALSIGETDFDMGADKTAQSGYLSFSDAGNRFKVGANGTDKSGYVGLNLGSDSVYANVTTAQQNLTWSIDGQDVALVTDLNAGTGSVSFSQNGVNIGLAANSSEKSGEFHLTTGDIKLDLSAGIETQTASIDFKGEGVTASAEYASTAQSMAMTYDDFSLAINKTGATAGTIQVEKGSDKVSVGVDYASKKADFSIESGTVKVLADINATNYTGSLDVTVDANKVNTTITEEQKALGISFGTTKTNSYIKSNGDLGFDLAVDDYKTGFVQEGINKTLSFGKGDFAVAFSNTKQATFSFDGTSFSIDFSKGKPNVLKNGVAIDYNLSNVGTGTVNFADYTNGKLQLQLDVTATKSTLQFNNLITLSSEVSGPTSLAITVEGKVATLSKAANNQVTFALDGNNLKIDPAGSLELNLGTSKQIKASKEALSVKIDNYAATISKTNLALSDGSNNFTLDKTALLVNASDKKLGLYADKRLELELSATQKLSLTPTNMAVTFDKVNVSLSSDKKLSFNDGTRNINISAEEFTLSQGDMAFSATSNKTLNITSGTHSIAISPETALLKTGSHELAISAEKSISYAGNGQSFAVSTEGMDFDIDGKKVSLTKDYTLAISDNGADILNITKENVALNFDNRAIAFGTTGLSYSDSDRSFDFSKDGVALSEGGNTLSLTRELEFSLITADSKTLNINTNGASLNYDNYKIHFDKTTGLSYTDGDRSLAFGGDGIEITEGVYTLGFTSDNKLELSDGANKQLSIAADKLDVTFDDKKFSLSEAQGLSYSDGVRNFEVGKQGLEMNFEIDGKTISLTKDYNLSINTAGVDLLNITKENVTLNFDNRLISFGTDGLKYKDNDRSFDFGDEGVALTEAGNVISLSPDLEFELVTADSKSLKVSTNGASLNYDNYKIDFDKTTGLSYTDGDRSLAFGGDGIEITEGVYTLGFTSNNTLELSDGANKQLSIAADKLDVTFDDKKFSLSEAQGLSYSDGVRNFEVGKQGLEMNFEIDGKTISLTKDYNLSINTAGVDLLNITKENVTLNFDNRLISFGTDGLKYKDNDRSFDFGDEGVALTEAGNVISLSPDLEFELITADYKALKVSTNGASLNYDNYKIDFDKTTGLSYTDGDRSLAFGGDGIEITEGVYTLGFTSNNTLELSDGANKQLSIAADKLDVKFDDKKFSLSEALGLSYSDGVRNFEVGKQGLEMNFEIDGKTISLTKDYNLSIAENGKALLSINQENVAMEFDDRQINFGVSGLSYKDLDRSFNFTENGVALSEGGNTLSLTRELEFSLITADSKTLNINTNGAALTYDDYKIGFDKIDGLSYADGTRSLAFGGEGIEIKEGDFELGFTKENTLTLSNGTTQKLAIDAAGLAVTFDDKQFQIGKEVGLKYSDADRSFELGKTGLEVAFEDYLIKAKAVNGKPAIEMVKGSYAFLYSDGQGSFIEGKNSLILGGENYFALDYDGKLIKGNASAISYEEDDLLLAFGGDDIIHLAQGTRSLKVTKDKELILKEDNTSILVAADQRLELTDGTRTFKLGGDDIVSYAEGSDKYRLFSPSAGVYGVGINKGDYGLALTGGKSTPAAFTVNSPYGDLTLSSDQQSNIALTYGGNTLKTGKQGISWESADGSSPAEAQPEQLATAAHVDYSGPQYIGDKITGSSGGLAKGSIQMYYNSGEKHFIANAAIESVIPPCIKGAMAAEASPKTWRIDVGTEDQRVEVYPSCSGFGGGGWMNLTPEKLGIGVFVGWKAGGSVDIGVAEITAVAGAELGIKAKMQLQPTFKINEAGIWVLVYAEVSIDPVIGSKFTIAEASLKGTLTMYFEEKTRVNGTLDGYINVCGISSGFDMDFNTSF